MTATAGMTATVAMMIATSALVVLMIGRGEAWEEANVIHVSGKVLCQDCTKGWNEWVNGSNPIKGSRVSLTCMDDRKRVMYYASDETDEAGDYELIADKYVNGKEVKATGCWVRLVSSPDTSCNIPTDFSGGRSGVKLHRPTWIYRDQTKYTIDAFYYTTPLCDEPNQDETESNY